MTRSSRPRLVLWDVDHTLLSVGQVSRELYAQAFELTIGRPPVAVADMAGRTERAIVTDTLALNGVAATEEVFPRFYTALGKAAQDLERRMAQVGRALPGARAAIDALARDGVAQSLVTGNIRPVATAKLAALGLDRTGLDLDTGGYGDHSSDRAALVEWAIARSGEKYGTAFAPREVVVVGDTPHDVRGAHDAGAKAVGVATGRSSRGELLAAGADAAVDSLDDTALFLDLLSSVGAAPATEG